MGAAFVHARRQRRWLTAAVLIAVYAALAGAVIVIDAAWWLMAALALPSLPALWELFADPAAGLRLDARALSWHSGRRRAEIALSEIDHMRFDTRWDLSVRVSAVLKTGKRLRLPHESLPPHRVLAAECAARGLRIERHHFTVF